MSNTNEKAQSAEEKCKNEGCGMPFFHCECGLRGLQFKGVSDKEQLDRKYPVPDQLINPAGLHEKYFIQRIVKAQNPIFNPAHKVSKGNTPYFLERRNVDYGSEYFVLRLDQHTRDINHLSACRIAVNAYADAIEPFIPKLSADLRLRYPSEDYQSQQSRISQLEADLAETKSQFDKCEALLARLSDLKYLKDNHGKDEFYEREQPLAWKDVKEYINNRKH